MERSQSCTHFKSQNISDNNNNNNENDILTTTIQFNLMQQKSASGSNLNVNQLQTSATNNYSPTPLNVLSARRKRKLLQRQQSREYTDDDMDYEYAADHEDDDEDMEEMHLDEKTSVSIDDALIQPKVDPANMQRPQLNPLTIKKHMQFQRRKPQSSNALLLNAISCANSLPPPTGYNCCNFVDRQRRLKHEESFDSSSSAGVMSLGSPSSPHRQFSLLKRDNSIHSDSSRYSSVDSLLEARKPDPEAILINLGFGPVGSEEDILSRIPKRFLKPSQVPGNDTEAFVRRLQLASSLADHSVLGYRGLTGNPDVPPSFIVAKIMRRFEVNERKKSMASIEHTIQ